MSFNRYFKRSEFACKCGCGFDTVDYDLVKVLTVVREHFASPVTINSASRCESHNESVGGAKGSQHRLGRAADITVKGVLPIDVYNFINGHAPYSLGVGSYNSFTHIDTRLTKARW